MLFIAAFKLLAHPKTAIRGNLLSAFGMLIAIVVTFSDTNIKQTWPIILAAVIGSGIGSYLAIRTPMTAMPQMVALLNGFGGAASFLVAGASLQEQVVDQAIDVAPWSDIAVAVALTGLIGAVTLNGSLVAYFKLEEKFLDKLRPYRRIQWVNAGLGVAALAIGLWSMACPGLIFVYWLLVLVSLVLGVTLTMPIGGADMPVVICLLNSYSGLAAAASGFVISNSLLIIAGSLVGASGIILSQIMCKAMNRSLLNVLFGGLGTQVAGPSDDAVYGGKVKSASAEEIAMMLEGARRVVIVPGYGLAVAQAQHAVKEFASLLESRGTDVLYGIHPVAGRMPGHMNVLLAEANISYEKTRELDDINSTFPDTDVAIVIGANDVVNPAARTDPNSPIAGMPILNVDQARNVVVVKRSLSPGFAKIPNPLFAAPNTVMFYNDGKKALLELSAAVKEL